MQMGSRAGTIRSNEDKEKQWLEKDEEKEKPGVAGRTGMKVRT
jgi:hypothetical protein